MHADLPARMPRHVAIIMDGNGRWATARGLPRAAGHRKGVEALRATCKAAREMGIEFLTIFGFSSENWRRPSQEIRDLMQLLRFYLRSELAALHRQGTRLRVIGNRSRLDHDIVQMISHAEEITRHNQETTLVVALSYGSRQEITDTTRRLVEEALAGSLSAAMIDEARFESYLSTYGIPDPDLVIRTSGEKRLSNFLLWQSAYAELVFVDTLWPEFGRSDLENAIGEYMRRERRFGASASY